MATTRTEPWTIEAPFRFIRDARRGKSVYEVSMNGRVIGYIGSTAQIACCGSWYCLDKFGVPRENPQYKSMVDSARGLLEFNAMGATR